MRALARAFLFTLACVTIAWAQLGSGLVAYYPFNGNSNDESGNDRNLTNNGATPTADRFGNANSAFSFNGVTSYLQANDYPALLTTFTYSAWIRVTDPGSFDKNNNFASYGLEDTGDNTWGMGYNVNRRFMAVDDRTNGGWMPTLDIGSQWTHVVIVYDSTARSIYINGALFAGPQSITTPISSPPSNNLRIGRHLNGDSQEFLGMIDDIRVYDRALSGDEITELYHEWELCGQLSGIMEYGIYHVTCDLLVPAGDTLVIEPGVTLQFMGPYKFEVRGTLLAEGTEEDSIVFTTDTVANPERWRGMDFLDSTSSGSRLAYCVVENSKSIACDADDGGGICCRYSSPTFRRCVVSRNTSQCAGGGIACQYSSPTFEGCYITGNHAGNYGGGVISTLSSPLFRNCVFRGNSAEFAGGGMSCHWGYSPSFINCTLVANTAGTFGGGAYIDGALTTFNGTAITFSVGAGIYFWDGAGSQVQYCDMFGNTGGAFAGSIPSGVGQIVTTNHNGDSCDAYYNIFLDPMFVNAGAGDYHLTANSPCIDAGDPAMFDPDCTPSDMGAFYFFHLAQPESLVAQQQGHDMLLRWSVVDSTECGFPSPIKSYVVFYEQDFDEAWDFLAATEDTFFVHENVLLFPPPAPRSHFYDVVATDIEIDVLNRAVHLGMSRDQVEVILREDQRSETAGNSER